MEDRRPQVSGAVGSGGACPELPCPPPVPPQTLLQHMPEQEEMRAFPGPLGKYVPTWHRCRCAVAVATRGLPVVSPVTECCSCFRDDTHKVDVINFAQSKATKCLQNETLLDKESASLLWNFIVLLCRQNGVRVFFSLEQPLSLALSLRNPWSPGRWAGFPCQAVHGEWCAVQLLLRRSVLAVTWGRGRETGVQLGGREVWVPMSACQVRLAPGSVGSGSVSSWWPGLLI